MPKGVFKAPYANRFRALFNMVKGGKYIRIIETRIVNSLSEAYKHCEEKLLLEKKARLLKTQQQFERRHK